MNLCRPHFCRLALLASLLLSLTGCPSAPEKPRVFAGTVDASSEPLSVKEPLTVISWNAHKPMINDEWYQQLKRVKKQFQPQIAALQEMQHLAGFPWQVPGYHWQFGANLDYGQSSYAGLMTLTRNPVSSNQLLLSTETEPVIGTPKAGLISMIPLDNHQELLVLNVHAINFVRDSHYQTQLTQWRQALEHHQGPMLILGDFNTWSQSRLAQLQALTDDLGLSPVTFDDAQELTQFMGSALDHIFYSCQLHLDSAQVLEKLDSSDHLPLLASFRWQQCDDKPEGDLQ